MTIDEAIKHCEEVAENYRCQRDDAADINDVGTASDCQNCADEHEQLAEWLTELKQWRRVYGVCPSYEMCIPECKEGYNAQIAEYKRLLKMAVEDISKMPCDNDTHSPDSCYICVKHGNCSYADSFKWCKADEALKLIGEDENET